MVRMRSNIIVVLLLLIGISASCIRDRRPHGQNRLQFVETSDGFDENKDEVIVDEDASVSWSQEELDLLIPAMPKQVPSQTLERTGYVASYNKEMLCPNWVAWHLTAEHADGMLPRDNAFYEDMDVPAPRATNEDYRGSGWSRGHMCPAGDNKWDEKAMHESNLLTNICPQDRNLNSGVWNRIEQDCRRWAKKYDDVYIVCGPIFLKRGHETIGMNKVVVPEAFFKVVLCLQGTPKAIGFVVRNNEGKKKRDQFVNSIDEVERITGYDFFSALPDSIETVVEAKADIREW